MYSRGSTSDKRRAIAVESFPPESATTCLTAPPGARPSSAAAGNRRVRGHHSLAHLADRGGLVRARGRQLDDRQGEVPRRAAQFLVGHGVVGARRVVREPVVEVIARNRHIVPSLPKSGSPSLASSRAHRCRQNSWRLTCRSRRGKSCKAWTLSPTNTRLTSARSA